MENPDQVFRKKVTLKTLHIPGQLNVVTNKLSRMDPTIQTGFPVNLHQVAPTSDSHFCNKVQQVTSVCATSFRPPSLGSGCTQPALGGSGPLCSPTSSHSGQSGGEIKGLPVQENHSDCSRVAQNVLALGSNGHVKPNPSVPARPGNVSTQ